MIRELFIDTTAWYALADADDKYHVSAKEFLPEALSAYLRLVTSNHVIGETYTLIRTRLGFCYISFKIRILALWMGHRLC